MRCSSPIWLKNSSLLVPCGKCYCCRSHYRDTWTLRLLNHYKSVRKGIFLTLSYNDDNIPLDRSVSKVDLQLFFKRLRKHYPSRTISYFAASEYGDKKFRPHYHIIVFGIDCPTSNYLRIRLSNFISKSVWKKGYCFVGDVNEKTIKYTTKYILKDIAFNKDKDFYEFNNLAVPFTLKSTKLGLNYFLSNISSFIDKAFSSNVNNSMPRYYRVKLIELGFLPDDFFLKKMRQSVIDFKEKAIKFITDNTTLKLDYYRNCLYDTTLEFYFNDVLYCSDDLKDNHWYSIYSKLYLGSVSSRFKKLSMTWKTSIYE